MDVRSSAATLTGNSVSGGGLFVTSYEAVSGAVVVAPTVQNNAVSNTTELAVGVSSTRIDPDLLTGNTASNASVAVGLNGTLIDDLVVPSQLGLPLVLTGELTVPAGVAMTVEAGAVIKGAGYDGWSGYGSMASLRVLGSLDVNGTALEPVVFTSIRDDSVGGDTNRDGTATAPAVSNWSGIRVGRSAVDAPPVVSLDHAKIRYASTGVSRSEGTWSPLTLDWVPGPLSITNTEFAHVSRSVVVKSRSSVTVADSVLVTSDDIKGLVAQGRTITETLEIARDVVKKLMESQTNNANRVI